MTTKNAETNDDWRRPRSFDYNLVVIGAGAAGLVSAYIAAATKARVAIVERDLMGGECLNTGCVPSKALIRSAKLAKESSEAARFGLRGELTPDFSEIMARIGRVIGRIAVHDSAERYRSLGVEVINGNARVLDPWTIDVDGLRITTRNIIVATGAEPAIPPITGLDQAGPLTSETIWSLTEQPETLAIVGGGAVGCELAQSFARLGTHVVLIEAASRLLAREEPEASEFIGKTLVEEGVELHVGVNIERFERDDRGRHAVWLGDGRSIPFDKVLIAAGRKPRTSGFGLEELGLLDKGRLVVDRRMRTRIPNILAAGDVIGELQLTHAASQYAWFAAINALFGALWRWSVDVRVFPAAVYTDPEVARVGLTEAEAGQQGIPYETLSFDLADLDRAIADEADTGFIKILTVPGKDKILGVTIVGARAGDMIAEFALAMKHGLGLKAILRTIHAYPGWMEANKAAAGQWQRTHVPAWVLRLSEGWHRWQRS